MYKDETKDSCCKLLKLEKINSGTTDGSSYHLEEQAIDVKEKIIYCKSEYIEKFRTAYWFTNWKLVIVMESFCMLVTEDL